MLLCYCQQTFLPVWPSAGLSEDVTQAGICAAVSHETELSSFLLGTWHTLLRLVSMESQEHLEGIAAVTASFEQLSAASTSQEAALRQSRASIQQVQVRCRLPCASTIGSFQVPRFF